jgi:murein hydrolase activator
MRPINQRLFALCFALLIGVGLNISAGTPSLAQASSHEAAANAQAQLQAIQDAISLSETRREELRLEIERMSGDRAQQNAELIAAAQRVKITEIEVASIEENLTSLLAEESEIRTRLDSADTDIASLLVALQRIGKNPPPALVIDPSDALSSARAAMLLSAVLPQLRQKADQVVADLNQLATIKQDVIKQKETLTARLSSLQEEQLRIATLIVARKRGVVIVTAELEAQEKQAEALAAEATSLNQLITTLKQRIAAVTEAAAAADAAETDGPVAQLSPETIEIALANTERTSPAVPFSAAKGYLLVPAAGVVVTEFGSNDGFGGISQGVSIATRAEAQVVSPSDGWVMYKGPYLNYGQIIIINPGQGHTILLAGLDEVSVDLGQFVLMGEPVGTMGSRTIGQTVTTSAGVLRPTLYIELRNQDVPLDPAPWWSRAVAQTQSQTQSG